MPDRAHPNEIQPKLCGLAERVASEHFETHLDYSVDSVQGVERILGALHDDYRKTRSDDGLNGIALEFAAYIVSIIQRHFGPAEWERDCPSFGEDAFPLHWRGSSIYPYAWCQKRIFDGPADDVWFKFQAIVLGKTQPQQSEIPGDRGPQHFQAIVLGKTEPRRPWWRFWS